MRELLTNPAGVIINPKPPHREAMEFFQMILEGNELVCDGGDPLRPTVGAYLYGPPGVGKTHIMAAFGRIVEATLQARLADIMSKIRLNIDMIYRQYQKDADTDKAPDGRKIWTISSKGATISETPDEKFQKGLEGIKRILVGSKDQPTDVLYLGFDNLYQLYRSPDTRADALEAIEKAPIVFVDDLHSKNDPSRLEVIQQLMERRYELGKFGTFVTTNIDVEHIGGDEENERKRILSRSKETFVPFDLTECEDWRDTMKQRRIKMIKAEIQRRVTKRDATPPIEDDHDASPESPTD